MRIVRRVVKLLVVIVLALVVVAGGTVTWITARAFPQTAGTLRLAGLEHPVTVVRDANGIAQITADTTHDLLMAQGYVHAQERLWQMEVTRHIGAGRLAELFGKGQLNADRFIRTLDWQGAARRDLEALSATGRAALDAYAAGVNAYIDAHKGSLGVSFVVAGLLSQQPGGLGGYTPEPWTPLDSLTYQKVQAFNLGGNYAAEIFRMLADARLGDPKLTDQLFPAYGADMPVITPSGLQGSGGLGATASAGSNSTVASSATAAPASAGSNSTVASTATTASPDGPLVLTDEQAQAWRDVAQLRSIILAAAGLDGGGGIAGDSGIGSNNWVVAPSKSAPGGALLANDPHLGLGIPSVWYMNGLHCKVVSEACPYDVTGVSFPGEPLVILGHNARIAWGATNANPDVQDLYVETVDPADPTHYLDGGKSVAFTTRTETIKVAGGDAVTITVRSTRHGPVLNDVDNRLKEQPKVLALHWAALSELDHTLESFVGMGAAKDFASFRAALSVYGAPSQNFVYADVDGHIGYQLPGLVPIRPKGVDGRRPVDGSTSANDWAGYVKFDDLPRQLDPAGGVIVSANNLLVDVRYPYLIQTQADPGWRASRIVQMLGEAAASGGVTTDELRAIQLDALVPRAAKVIKLLGSAAPSSADGSAAWSAISSWDGRCDLDSRGCAAYMALELALEKAIFDDELGPIARDYVGSAESWQGLLAVLADPKSAWWANGSVAGDETPADVVAGGLDTAGGQLRAALGGPDQWTWSRLHVIRLAEATLGVSGIAPLEWYFDQPTLGLAGAAGAVNNEYWKASTSYPDPWDAAYKPVPFERVFWVTNGPSYRLTIDMKDIDGARIIQTSGQSGNPFDRHYGDHLKLWATGQMVPLPFSAAAVAASAESTLTLTP